MFLKILETKKEISIGQYKDLRPSGSRPGIRYGLAKVHWCTNMQTCKVFSSNTRTPKNQ